MSKRSDPELWKRITALLDEFLELEETECEARLAQLRSESPFIAAEVERLLRADRSGQDPFGKPPAQWAHDFIETLAQGEAASQRFGPWKVLRTIGRGGMGVVFLAERVEGDFEQRVALKVLDRPDPEGKLARRFEQERRILAPLEHPNIARLLDGGTTEKGVPWFAMEYIDGESITHWCANLKLGVPERIDLFIDVCQAVAHAHSRLVVHRDLKPSNILVSTAGQVKLVDFGIAKLLAEEAEAVDRTQTVARLLTPRYASPEQIRGEPVTTSSDVYALGTVLYELLSGEPPFAAMATTEREWEDAILSADLPSLPSSLPSDLGTIVEKALRKEPEHRYRSAEALAEDLQRYRQMLPIHARPATARYKTNRFLRRHRTGTISAGLLLLALLGGLLTTVWQARIASRQAARANQVKEFLVEIFSESSQAVGLGQKVTTEEVLDAGAKKLQSHLHDQPRLRSELLLLLGDLNVKLGRFDLAESLLTQARDESEQGFGPESVETVKVLTELGSALEQRGLYEQALEILNEALAIQDRHGRDHSEETSTVLGNLAVAYSGQGDLEKAIELHKRVLQLDRQRLGPDDPEVATDLNNLAVNLGKTDQYAAADSLHKLALDIRVKRLGNLHPDVATSLHNRAAVLTAMGSDAEAESLYLRCLSIRRELYPKGHPDTAAALTSLALLYRQQGRLEEAGDYLRQAVAIHHAVSVNPSYELGRTLNALGTLEYSLGNYAEAAEWMSQALEVFRATSGAENPSTLTVLNNVAVLLERAGKLKEARARYEEVLELRRRVLGEDDPSLAFSYRGLGALALAEGKVAEAESLLQKSQAIFLEHAPEEKLALAEIQLDLGRCALRRGDLNAAELLLRSALEGLEARLTPDHPLLRQAHAAMQTLDALRVKKASLQSH